MAANITKATKVTKVLNVTKRLANTLANGASKAAELLRNADAGTMSAARIVLGMWQAWDDAGKPGQGFQSVIDAVMNDADRRALTKGRVSQFLSAARIDAVTPCKTESEARSLNMALRLNGKAKSSPEEIRLAVDTAGGIAKYCATSPKGKSSAATKPTPKVTADSVHECVHDMVMGIAPSLDRDGLEGLADTLAVLSASLRKLASAEARKPSPIGKARKVKVQA